MVGNVVHYWQPNHPDHHYRSNVNRTILLVKIGERHVPIGEKGIKEYNTIGLVAAETLPTTVQGDESSRSGVAPGRQHSLEAVSEDTTSAIAVDSSTIVSSDRASTEANDMQSSPQSETQITSTTGNIASQGGTESEPKGVPDSMEEPAESSVDAAQTK